MIEFASMIASCMVCRSAVLNVTVDGELVQVEYGQGGTAAPGVVALNRRTRGARAVAEQDMASVESWARQGASFHRRHADVCVGRRA